MAMGTDVHEAMQLAGPLADRDAWSTDRCPAAAALDVVGSRSAVLIMREALYGTTRFDDFVTRVGVTEGVASGRLRELVELGLLARVPYREPGRRTRDEYRLTEKGADFAPVVMALFEWGVKYLRRSGRAPFDFEHHDAGGAPTSAGTQSTDGTRSTDGTHGCGAAVHVRMVCDDGHEVGPRDVLVRRPTRATPTGQPIASNRGSATARRSRARST